MPRGDFVLHSALNGAVEFAERNKNIPERCGKAPVPGWRKKDIRNGYSYRHDAVRFCWQLFYPEHASKSMNDGDILAWFDGDVVFTNHMPRFIEGTLNTADLAYLGRVTHTELGFWAIRLSAATREFLWFMPELYRSGQVFKLPEWHSAYVFDYARSQFPIRSNDLTPGKKGNVWQQCQLQDFSIHLKGNLKQKGLDKIDKAQEKGC